MTRVCGASFATPLLDRLRLLPCYLGNLFDVDEEEVSLDRRFQRVSYSLTTMTWPPSAAATLR
jgi:hypothetical protein